MWVVSISNLKLATVSLRQRGRERHWDEALGDVHEEISDTSPSHRNPPSSSIKLLEQVVHRLVEATERGREGLWSHLANIKVINAFKWLQIMT